MRGLLSITAFGIFIFTAAFILGCQTVEKTGQVIKEDFKLDSDPTYPQGLQHEVDEYGEP